MLATSCRKKTRPVKTALKREAGAQTKVQSLLAVARSCRDCGQRLSPLEDALHQCSVSLEWPFPAESLSSDGCRVVRLGPSALRGAAGVRLVELWEKIRDTELSHALELPSAERLANHSAWLLLALRGKEVLALLSAERVPASWAAISPESASRTALTCDKQKSIAAPLQPHSEGAVADHEARTPPRRAGFALGVAVVWVRRRERRRGLATALVDCARRISGGAVAFSQPTELGFAFASAYTRHRGSTSLPLVYEPDWEPRS
ncbi:unnamed protein product [Effrenium voratum]|uniref:N-acetyltransferase ESCO acetyl-transferase domain-containing protein n=1 Tax=Effrenium voratum TaxID=2562239 RepID=A0AA36IUY2_9DINO|nr:unnamed protein product [Effrenium voratum]